MVATCWHLLVSSLWNRISLDSSSNMVEILVVVTCWHLLVFSFWNWISLDSSSNMVDNCPLSLDGNFNRLFLKLNPVFILVVGSPHSLVQCALYYCSSLAAWAEIYLNFWDINFGECPLKKTNKRELKFIILQVTFTRIQQSSIKSKQTLLPSKTVTYK